MMEKEDYSDLQSCCTVQPRRNYSPASKATRNLTEELLKLLDYNTTRAEAILRELVRQAPNKSLEWYYETAIKELYKQKQNSLRKISKVIMVSHF